ncbi:hypothetical protein FY528_08060 [Hymenobacter lutimineralis]|uniref:Uncharacterized protein n=1 Tax=Hymenobacter lutimineralis TaxID=2606448 RepID=A0A5D6V744_9BACT|nr:MULTISPECIES: hypothetical protein [Hymenobacter]QIX62849.1 hypothetical protein HER32_17385 [Hymenobacter sp. BT18]TYZ10995.1 hypothetical protein FY528_08060 [Hymenobacter lutimineralis]
MSDLTKTQALLAQTFGVPVQLQGSEQGVATLTVQPDDQKVLGPAGSQLVYQFEQGRFVSLEILVAAG